MATANDTKNIGKVVQVNGPVLDIELESENQPELYNVAADPVHVHDLHATMLHLLGVDHTRLTFKFQGRHYRLTDVHGKVVTPIVA